MSESKFFFINSSISKEFYPDNTPFHFTNQLLIPFRVEDERDWEVGVHEVLVMDEYEEPAPQQNTFFGHQENDDQFSVVYKISAEARSKKLQSTPFSFITAINRQIKMTFSAVKVEIELIVKPGIPLTCKIKFQDAPPGAYLELNPKLQELLGQPSNKIMNSSREEHVFNLELFNSMDPEEDLIIKYVVPRKTGFTLSEPEQYTIESLMKQLEEKLKTVSPNVKISYYIFRIDDEPFLNLLITPKQASIIMPEHINTLFGMPVGYVFEGSASNDTYTRYKVPVEISNMQDIPQELILCSNIVLPSFIYGKMKSILRVLHRKKINKPEMLRFETVIYQSLSSKHLEHISLTITDAKFNPIKSLSYPTSALIEIRKKPTWNKPLNKK